jgi:hypothetical protein
MIDSRVSVRRMHLQSVALIEIARTIGVVVASSPSSIAAASLNGMLRRLEFRLVVRHVHAGDHMLGLLATLMF